MQLDKERFTEQEAESILIGGELKTAAALLDATETRVSELITRHGDAPERGKAEYRRQASVLEGVLFSLYAHIGNSNGPERIDWAASFEALCLSIAAHIAAATPEVERDDVT